MSQAKVLSEPEFKRVLAVVGHDGKHAARNRLVVLLAFLGGMRAGEIAALKMLHVTNEGGSIRDRIHLASVDTKGPRGRTVFVGKKLQREIGRYVKAQRRPTVRLFRSGISMRPSSLAAILLTWSRFA